VADFELRFKPGAIRQLLTDPATVAAVAGIARKIAAAAGPGMVALPAERTPRARAAVVTATYEAMRAEATSRALTRAIDAGRS
jgi:hypothetical protein